MLAPERRAQVYEGRQPRREPPRPLEAPELARGYPRSRYWERATPENEGVIQ